MHPDLEKRQAAIADFIRTRGVTRCPTACVLPTQGLIDAADRLALAEYAIDRERLRQARAAAVSGDDQLPRQPLFE